MLPSEISIWYIHSNLNLLWIFLQNLNKRDIKNKAMCFKKNKMEPNRERIKLLLMRRSLLQAAVGPCRVHIARNWNWILSLKWIPWTSGSDAPEQYEALLRQRNGEIMHIGTALPSHSCCCCSSSSDRKWTTYNYSSFFKSPPAGSSSFPLQSH